MPKTIFKGVRIAGMAGAVPTTVIENRSFIDQIGEKAVEKVIKNSGVERFHRSPKRQTAGDLSYVAARELLEKKGIDINEIGLLLNITETPDYIAPSTAFVIHKRLGLPIDCIAFDVNLGCTGFVYGINIAASILSTGTKKFAIITLGDVGKHGIYDTRKNPDNTYLMMMGDGCAAVLVEKSDDDSEIVTDLYADSNDFAVLHTMGGARCFDVEDVVTTWSDGIDRSPLDPYMDGMAVFSFSTRTVPKYIKLFMEERKETFEDYSGVYFHQANKMILDRLTKILGIPEGKTPSSLANYGNTNGASIPFTILNEFKKQGFSDAQHVMLCGFGVGLSWGIVSANIVPSEVFSIVESDDIYEEGEFLPF